MLPIVRSVSLGIPIHLIAIDCIENLLATRYGGFGEVLATAQLFQQLDFLRLTFVAFERLVYRFSLTNIDNQHKTCFFLKRSAKVVLSSEKVCEDFTLLSLRGLAEDVRFLACNVLIPNELHIQDPCFWITKDEYFNLLSWIPEHYANQKMGVLASLPPGFGECLVQSLPP